MVRDSQQPESAKRGNLKSASLGQFVYNSKWDAHEESTIAHAAVASSLGPRLRREEQQ